MLSLFLCVKVLLLIALLNKILFEIVFISYKIILKFYLYFVANEILKYQLFFVVICCFIIESVAHDKSLLVYASMPFVVNFSELSHKNKMRLLQQAFLAVKSFQSLKFFRVTLLKKSSISICILRFDFVTSTAPQKKLNS